MPAAATSLVLPPRLCGPAVVILVDFDNFYVNASLEGDDAWLVHDLNELVSLAIDVVPEVSSILVRLYGGWLEGGMPTRKASKLHTMRTMTRYFPVPDANTRSMIDGEILLVTRSLDLPELEWQNTLKSKRGLPRLRFAPVPLPQACVDSPGVCPVEILRRLSRKKTRKCAVDSCNLTSSEAFQLTQQKMVDTLLCCDLLTSAAATDVGGVIVLTNDLDILPAVASASKLQSPLILVRHDAGHDASEDPLLTRLGIRTLEW